MLNNCLKVNKFIFSIKILLQVPVRHIFFTYNGRATTNLTETNKNRQKTELTRIKPKPKRLKTKKFENQSHNLNHNQNVKTKTNIYFD